MDEEEGLTLLWVAAERYDLDTRSRRSISCTKWLSRSDERRVMPQTGQQEGSNGDFFRPSNEIQREVLIR